LTRLPYVLSTVEIGRSQQRIMTMKDYVGGRLALKGRE